MSNKPIKLVIVAGGRDYTNKAQMFKVLNELAETEFLDPSAELVCGMARGADMTAYHLFKEHGNIIHEMPADWDSEPRRAGYIRNAEMGNMADGLVAFWDGKSKGTKHMIDYMTKLGKPVHVHQYFKPQITVVNRHHGAQGVYIGRGTPLGNPFQISGSTTREQAIEQYRKWLDQQIDKDNMRVINELDRLSNMALEGPLKLVCSCSPAACHGDYIKHVLEQAIHKI